MISLFFIEFIRVGGGERFRIADSQSLDFIYDTASRSVFRDALKQQWVFLRIVSDKSLQPITPLEGANQACCFFKVSYGLI